MPVTFKPIPPVESPKHSTSVTVNATFGALSSEIETATESVQPLLSVTTT